MSEQFYLCPYVSPNVRSSVLKLKLSSVILALLDPMDLWISSQIMLAYRPHLYVCILSLKCLQMSSGWIIHTAGPDPKKCIIRSKYFPQTLKYAICHQQKLWSKICYVISMNAYIIYIVFIYVTVYIYVHVAQDIRMNVNCITHCV